MNMNNYKTNFINNINNINTFYNVNINKDTLISNKHK